jgi:hypothetical protein
MSEIFETTSRAASQHARARLGRAVQPARKKRLLGEDVVLDKQQDLRMPKITHCYDSHPVTPSLTETRILQFTAAAIVLAFLGICHLWLQFATADARLQYQQVQTQHRDLLQKVSLLQSQNERLCEIERLRQYGETQLNMIEADPVQRQVARVPNQYIQKYMGEEPKEQNGVLAAIIGDVTGADTSRGRIEQFLLTVTDMNRAIAGEK